MADAQNVRKFTRRQRLFIEWLATSKYQRIPPTQGKLAEELGVHERTLSRWKKLPGLIDESIKVARQHTHDRLPEVYEALAREAEAGSFQHIKLMLELTGEYQEKKAVDVTTKGESFNEREGTDERRIRAAVGLYEALRAEIRDRDSGGQGAVDTAGEAVASPAEPGG